MQTPNWKSAAIDFCCSVHCPTWSATQSTSRRPKQRSPSMRSKCAVGSKSRCATAVPAFRRTLASARSKNSSRRRGLTGKKEPDLGLHSYAKSRSCMEVTRDSSITLTAAHSQPSRYHKLRTAKKELRAKVGDKQGLGAPEPEVP